MGEVGLGVGGWSGWGGVGTRGAVARLGAIIPPVVRVVKALGVDRKALDRSAHVLQAFREPQGLACEREVGDGRYDLLPGRHTSARRRNRCVLLLSEPSHLSQHYGRRHRASAHETLAGHGLFERGTGGQNLVLFLGRDAAALSDATVAVAEALNCQDSCVRLSPGQHAPALQRLASSACAGETRLRARTQAGRPPRGSSNAWIAQACVGSACARQRRNAMARTDMAASADGMASTKQH